MQTHQKWIWQHPDWANFSYDLKQLLPELTNLSRLIGGLEVVVLPDDAIETSAIEGDIRNNTEQLLTEEMLFAWQAALFPTGYSGLDKINVGCYRGNLKKRPGSGRSTSYEICCPFRA